MRLQQLVLERYGPFTGRVLDFNPAARLHLIYGGNEAGKSSTLAAITDLLFGIEERTRYNFRHANRDLRLGATLCDTAGRTLQIRRRKGRGETLLGPDDHPLSEATLAPLLGGVTRDRFIHEFGLNAETLRKGAESLLQAGGEVGQSLFAAGSGLHGLPELRRTLSAEAAALYTERGQKPQVNQLCAAHEAAGKQLRENEVRAGAFRDLEQRISDLGAAHAALEQRQADLHRSRTQLERVRRVAPLLRQWQGAGAALTALGDLPETPPGFAQDLTQALAARSQAQAEHQRAAAQVEAAQIALAAITVEAPLLAAAAQIEELTERAGAIRKARADLPGVQGEADGFARQLDALARRLGHSDAAALPAAPAAVEMAEIQALITASGTLDRAQAAIRKTLEDEETAIAEADRIRQQLSGGTAPDPRTLRAELAALSADLQQAALRAEKQRQYEQRQRALTCGRAALLPPLPPGDTRPLAALPLPDPATLADWVSAEQKLIRQREAASAQDAQCRAAQGRTAAALAAARQAGPALDPAALASRRAARDALWQRLRACLLDAPGAEPRAALGESVVLFNAALQECDRIADDLAAHADAVAGIAAALRADEAARRACRDSAAALADSEAADRAFADGWAQLWQPVGIIPLPPGDMTGWRRKLSELQQWEEELAALAGLIAAHDRALDALGQALHRLAVQAGLQPAAVSSPEALVRLLEGRIAQLEDSAQAAAKTQERCANAAARHEKALAALARHNAEAETWHAAWRAAMAELALPAETSPVAAATALEIWRQIPPLLDNYDDRRRRVQGMARDIAAFEADAAALLAIHGGDLPAAERAERQIEALGARLKTVIAADARRQQAQRSLDTHLEARARAAEALDGAETVLAACAAALPSDTDPADLPALASRLAERTRLHELVSNARQRLTEAGDGLSLAQLQEECAGFDPDQAAARLAELDADTTRLRTDAQTCFAALQAARAEHAALSTQGGAEQARQMQRGLESDIAAAARDWARLHLAEKLLAHLAECQRAQAHSPLLTRAGAHFATLTGGAFAAIDEAFAEDDKRHLVGRRAGSGETVPLDGLSEGTRDQLYLALRLAFIEAHAAAGLSLPFIGDDLFTSFDDGRTALGLTTLADLGAQVQPILFTHHRHLIDIARDTLGDGVSVMRLD